MRNPLARLVQRNPDKPTLRERAAALKASAARAMRKPLALPEPGSEEAMAQYRAASRAANERGGAARLGYSDLKRTPLEWWTRGTLSAALETGEISPTEYARLWPMAAERELRMDAALLKTNVGALHALAFANLYPLPISSDGPASLEPSNQPAEGAYLEPLMVRWREAAKVAEDAIDDDESTRLAEIMTVAEREIIRAEVRSVRDLACKIELLGTYRGVHDLDYGLSKFLLDAICKDVEALTRAEAARERAAGSRKDIVEDAELLALGREFDAVHAEWTPAALAGREAEGRAAAFSASLERRAGWTLREAHEAAWAQPGVSEAVDRQEALSARMEKITASIRTLPAKALDGLAVKARAAIPAMWTSGQYEKDAGLGGDEDWVELNARSLIDECLSLAGVDWTGRRIQDAVRVPEGASTITPKASASEIDLSGLGINDLCAFYETLKAARALWNGAMCEPRAEAKVYPSGCVDPTPFGERADFEDSRAGFLMDQVASEAAGRSPADRHERDSVLALRIEQEIACEGRIRDRALLADIAQAWG